jgi:DNA-binding beta-propeller fold protein YncE
MCGNYLFYWGLTFIAAFPDTSGTIVVKPLFASGLLLCASLSNGLTGTLNAEADAGELSRGLLVVANKGDETISIVDVNIGLQVAVIPENAKTGHELAVSPDGKRAFVPIYGSAGVGQTGTDGELMRVINLGTREIVGTVDFGKGVRPHRPVFGPVNGLLYVTTELENSVTIINPRSLKILGSIPTGSPQSHMLAITHDGRRGYTANVNPGTVSVLDLEENKLITTIPVATITQRIALSADDRWAFTADQTKLRLVVIDTQTDTVSTSIPLPGLAYGTAATPDGRWLIVALPAVNMVGLVDLTTMNVVRTLNVPKAPQEVLVRPDGAVAYVSCDASAQIAVIDVANWKLEKLIAVGRVADGLAWARFK